MSGLCAELAGRQAWWTLFGLLFDLVGFVILSLDLALDYRRHRSIYPILRSAELLERRSQRRGHGVRPSSDELREVEELLRVVEKTELGRNMARWIAGTEGSERGFDRSFAGLAEALRLFAEAADRRTYRRPPVFWALGFATLGFALQLVGALPCG